MRILVVTHNYPRFPGDPAGAFVQRLAAAAATAGNEVRVLTPHAPGIAEREREPSGVDVVRFRYAPESWERVGYRGDLHRLRRASLVAAVGIPAFLLAFRHALRRQLASARPDVIHAHWWFPGGWLAVGTGIPSVVTMHGSDVRLLDRGAIVRRLAGRVLGRAAAVTTVSRFLADDVRDALPVLHDRVAVTPMPVDVAHFSTGRSIPKVAPPRVLYAGNLVASKGVDVLLRAYARLRRLGVACRLRVLGEGPELPALRALATQLAIDDDVEWSSFVSQDRMPAEYGASTVAVLPTRGRAEGLGLSLVEALLAGCAVVGTPVGGIPEVVRPMETGLLAADGDDADLAEKLRILLTDAALRDRLTAAGDAMVRDRYASAPAARRFLTLYGEIIGRRRAA